MAFILPDHPFDPDQLTGDVSGIASDLGWHDSGLHRHGRHQLLFAQAGCMSIELAHRICLLPPSRAAWLPAGTPHRVLMRGVVAYRSLYFKPRAELPTEVQVIAVNPLLREVIERMAFWPWDKPKQEQSRLLALFMEELAEVPQESWQLPLPADPRLDNWLQEVTRDGALPARLNRLAERVGASDKTIGRIFMRDTGMSYQAWRQQWRLLRAMELLAEAVPISRVAAQLEFSSDSAFIGFFKQHTGQTPLRYLGARGK
ncbi:helix-turn-helix transcriptional regulator [Aeromonas sp. MR16]|uniref:AraC family transcriptional regulator n=1 Tax=Aeromonas sp. MR16 TaxID=2923420 RepID=UPI001F4B5ACA|nr:helix-turn-helix transcriptional regulator [Aeromonas sp. MR16]MCH7371947.1 helix-turn-helix transcriptional regulator [Aeromonas sp. MR16]